MTPDVLARSEALRLEIADALGDTIKGGYHRGYCLDIAGTLLPTVTPLLTQIDTLTARVAALEDALRPFTEIGGWYGQSVIPLPDDQERAFVLPNGWLNKARAALATTYPAKEEG